MNDSNLIVLPRHQDHDSPARAPRVGAQGRLVGSGRRRELQPLTFGGCVASVCAAYGEDRAEGLLRFAVNSGILAFQGRRKVEIAPRDPRMEGRPNRHDVTGLLRYFLQDGRHRCPVTPFSPMEAAPVGLWGAGEHPVGLHPMAAARASG